MSELKLWLFGEPRLEYDGTVLKVDRRKGLAMLAFLALARHRQPRDVLLALLWPNLNQERAAAALRNTLYTLTTLAPDGWLDKERSMVGLNHDNIWIDVVEFQSFLNRARSHKHESSMLCNECAGFLESAIDLYQAEFMSGFSITESSEYDHWLATQREWLQRELFYTLRRLTNFYGELGDFDTALVYANQWLALDPLYEPAHRVLMRLYASSGQRTMALRQYQRCVELLDIELATPPEEETNQLYAAIQAESVMAFTESVAVPPKTSIMPRLPSLLVGREQALTDIKRRLTVNQEVRSTVVIQGWPGVGKSTTVAMLAYEADIARNFPDGILWTSLGKTPNLLAELTVWAQALGLHHAFSERKIETISAQLAAALRDRRMLLIVDDVWQIDHALPFKVGGPGCAMVVTSRLNDIAQALAPTPYAVYRLSVLDEDAALDLLEHLSPETVADYPDLARELVNDLEGLPLAIQVAGRLLHAETRLGWDVRNLLEELRAGTVLLQAQTPDDVTTSPTIAALLRLSTDSLDYAMQQRFALLGMFAAKPTTFDLGALATVWDVDDAKPIVRVLVNRGLLEPATGGRFQMHALLVVHAALLQEEIMVSR